MNDEKNKALDDLLLATRILVNENIIDGFGHVSVRCPMNSKHYHMIRENGVSRREEAQFLELDEDSELVSETALRPSIERFIHGEIYRTRPDVNSVIHTHSPFLIPFGVSETSLQPLYHMCGFMHSGVPVFDIEHEHGATNMLVTTKEIGQSLVRSIDQCAMVLMRGHGATVVGSSVKEAVFRAYYATVNAQLQPTAIQLKNPKYLSKEEAFLADELHQFVLDRPWNYWKKKLES